MIERRRLMRAGEVARTFGVNPKTVTRWAVSGKLTSVRTLGGHRRFDPAEVAQLLAATVGSGSTVEGDAPCPSQPPG